MDTLIPALETYQYTSLQSGDSTFRILKLSRYQGPELECELLQPSLSKNRHTPYEALSYVWGSAERVECIVLNRKRFWVTDNLYSALQCLRQRDRDRYLWIDAICINQADKGEQSRQVQQMGAIFKLAERVLFWLGKATPEIITLMDALNQPQMTVAGCDIGQLTLDENRWDDYRIGLRQLLNRQWFTRVWILQEAANAQEATVCCGTFSIPAEAFAHAPSLIREEPKPHCQAVLNIMPGTSRSETWWGQERDLCTLLRMFQSSKATDERDKIYALLGMSTCSVDKQSIDIDYQTPTHEVVHKVMTYLLQSTPFSVHEMLNLMNNFITLDTIYFVPAVRREEATEILFPHLQSGRKLSRTEVLEYGSQSIAVVKDPSLFLFEKRSEKYLKKQETCHSQAVKLMLGLQTSKDAEHQKYDNGLQVIPWGSVEQHVKLVVVHDKKKAVLKAALEGYGQIVKRLLHMELGDVLGRELEESALQEAIEQEHIQAVHTLLHQSPYLGVKEGRYCKELQAAACKNTGATMKLLLEYGAKVTEQAVQAAAQNMSSGKDMMALLLDQRGDEVKVTKQVVQAAAQNTQNGKDVIALLLDRRGDEVKITEQVVQAAAQNTWSGKDVMALLLDRRGDEVKITEQVVQAAAQNTWNGKDVMTLLLDRRGDEVKITKQVVQAAAQNMQSGKDVMALLLDRHIHCFDMSVGTIVGLARSFDRAAMGLLLDRRGDEVKITEQVVQAAAQNTQSGKGVMALLLDRHIHHFDMSVGTIVEVARSFDRAAMELLLDRQGDKVKITKQVVQAAAQNTRSGKAVMTLLLDRHIHRFDMSVGTIVEVARLFDRAAIERLLDRRGDEVQITEQVVQAAAQNTWSGKDVMALLLDRRGDEVQITEQVVQAAAQNTWSGKDVMALLLDRHIHRFDMSVGTIVGLARSFDRAAMGLLLDRQGDEVKITKQVVQAAAQNTQSGKDVMALLLDRHIHHFDMSVGTIVEVARSFDRAAIERLLDRRGDEVQITEQVVQAAAQNMQSGKDVMALLLDRRGDEVKITKQVVQAAAQNTWSGKDVMALLLDRQIHRFDMSVGTIVEVARSFDRAAIERLLDRRGDEVQITEQVVQAAAQNMQSGKDVMALLLDRRGDKVKITEQVVQAAAQNTWSGKDVMALLLDQRGDKIKITKQVVQAAAQNTQSGKDLMTLLLDRREDEVKITEQVVQAAAQNTQSGKGVMALLLDRHIHHFDMSVGTIVEVARSFDRAAMELLLDRQGDKVKITKQVVQAAAQNTRSGKDVMTLLLDRHINCFDMSVGTIVEVARSFDRAAIERLLDQRGDEVQITEQVVQAAAQNTQSGKDLVTLLLDRRGDEVKITKQVVQAAAQNTQSGKDVMALLLDRRGDEVKITEQVVQAAAQNTWNGEDVMTLLLDRRGDKVKITKQVVQAAAQNTQSGKDVMALLLDRHIHHFDMSVGTIVEVARSFDRAAIERLLDRRGDEVQITEQVVQAAAQNMQSGKDVMALLLDRQGDEVQITEQVVQAAAQNMQSGKDVMALLLDRRGDEVKITKQVVQAAAQNMQSGKDVMALLLDQRGDEVKITKQVVQAAAQNIYSGKDVMALLLDRHIHHFDMSVSTIVEVARSFDRAAIGLLLDRQGDEVKITEQVVQAAAENKWSGKDVMALLLDRRGDEVKITEQVVQAAAENTWSGKDVMALLLDRRGDEVKITEQVVQAAAQHTRSGKDVMALLLDRRGDEVKITEQVVQAAAENKWSGKDVMALLLDRRGDEVEITEQVVQAAAQNMQSGKDVMALLLDRRGDEVKITEQVVQAAAQNMQSGKDVMALLLDRRGDEVEITKQVVQAAAQNIWNGKDVMALLLDRRGDEVEITEQVVQAAAQNTMSGKDVMTLLLDRRGDEVEITAQVVQAAAQNTWRGKDVMALLLDRRGDEVKITEQVVQAAAQNTRSGKDVMALLLDQRGDEIKITEQVVQAAAQNTMSGKDVMALLLDQRGDEVKITEQVVQAAAQNTQSGKDVIALLLDRRGREVKITQEVAIAAAKYGNRQILAFLLGLERADIRITQEVAVAAAGNESSGKELIKLLGQIKQLQVTEQAIEAAANSGQEDVLHLFEDMTGVDFDKRNGSTSHDSTMLPKVEIPQHFTA